MISPYSELDWYSHWTHMSTYISIHSWFLNKIHLNSNNQHSSMFIVEMIHATIQTHSSWNDSCYNSNTFKNLRTSQSTCNLPNQQNISSIYFHIQSQSKHFNQ